MARTRYFPKEGNAPHRVSFWSEIPCATLLRSTLLYPKFLYSSGFPAAVLDAGMLYKLSSPSAALVAVLPSRSAV
jgi:hypothetical protein